MLSFLANKGSYGLGWDVHVDGLLFSGLWVGGGGGHKKTNKRLDRRTSTYGECHKRELR